MHHKKVFPAAWECLQVMYPTGNV